MLDLKFIRENIDLVRSGAESKGITISLDEIFILDDKRRALIQECDTLKAKRNIVSAQVGTIKKQGGDASAVIAEMESVKNRIQEIDPEIRDIETNVHSLLLTLPNIRILLCLLEKLRQITRKYFAGARCLKLISL